MGHLKKIRKMAAAAAACCFLIQNTVWTAFGTTPILNETNTALSEETSAVNMTESESSLEQTAAVGQNAEETIPSAGTSGQETAETSGSASVAGTEGLSEGGTKEGISGMLSGGTSNPGENPESSSEGKESPEENPDGTLKPEGSSEENPEDSPEEKENSEEDPENSSEESSENDPETSSEEEESSEEESLTEEEGSLLLLKDGLARGSIALTAQDCSVYRMSSETSGLVAILPAGTRTEILSSLTDENGQEWACILAGVNDEAYYGYVKADVLMKEEGGADLMTIDRTNTSTVFPEAYQSLVAAMQEEHPNWIFNAIYTGLDFNTVLANEQSLVNRNLCSYVEPLGWKSMKTLGTTASGEVYNYNWQTDTFYMWEPTFPAASDEIVAYTLDTRNFINDQYIFMFEVLTYEPGYQTVDVVNAALKGTFMYDAIVPGADYTYAWLFHWVGETYNINPVTLASRVRQEQGAQGSSPLISGTYPGYESLYNYFNVCASGNTKEQIYATGLTVARKGTENMLLPGQSTPYSGSWNTPTKSIVGGALFMASTFILQGQDSSYLQKYDVDSTDGNLYWHQYMQAVEGPLSEGKNVRATYSQMGILDSAAFVFYIPVFENLPESCPDPSGMQSPNNCVANVFVNGRPVITDFDKDQTEFTFSVPFESTEVTIDVEAASSFASVDAPSTMKDLVQGVNTCSFSVTAQDGSVRNYTLKLTRRARGVSSSDDDRLVYGASSVSGPVISLGVRTGTPATITIDDYRIAVNGGTPVYLDGILEETTAADILSKLTISGSVGVGIYDSGYTRQYSSTEKVGTGCILVAVEASTGKILLSLPLIVYGDLNGDSLFDIKDFSLAKAALMGRRTFDGAQQTAADLNGDGSFDILDFSLMKGVLLGKTKLAY